MGISQGHRDLFGTILSAAEVGDLVLCSTDHAKKGSDRSPVVVCIVGTINGVPNTIIPVATLVDPNHNVDPANLDTTRVITQEEARPYSTQLFTLKDHEVNRGQDSSNTES